VKLYLDACCLNRPFDDQSQDRIRLETEAVLLIIQRCLDQEWTWYGSEVLTFELEQIPDADRWQKVRYLAKYIHTLIRLDSGITTRAQELSGIGISAFDALHIACAEEAVVDVFLTTDDRLIKLADRYPGRIQVRICNPLPWISEVMKE
jgi:predicted nucleic acid-binding protein